jgi:hypothetical protein
MTLSEQQGDIPEALDPFIGLKRDSSDPNSVTFLWSDGSPVNFEQWADLEPSNFEGQESCVRIYTGVSSAGNVEETIQHLSLLTIPRVKQNKDDVSIIEGYIAIKYTCEYRR